MEFKKVKLGLFYNEEPIVTDVNVVKLTDLEIAKIIQGHGFNELEMSGTRKRKYAKANNSNIAGAVFMFLVFANETLNEKIESIFNCLDQKFDGVCPKCLKLIKTNEKTADKEPVYNFTCSKTCKHREEQGYKDAFYFKTIMTTPAIYTDIITYFNKISHKKDVLRLYSLYDHDFLINHYNNDKISIFDPIISVTISERNEKFYLPFYVDQYHETPESNSIELETENGPVYAVLTFEKNQPILECTQLLPLKTSFAFPIPEHYKIITNETEKMVCGFFIFKNFKESIFPRRKIATEDVLANYLEKRGGALASEVHWWVLFMLKGYRPLAETESFGTQEENSIAVIEDNTPLTCFASFEDWAMKTNNKVCSHYLDYAKPDIPEYAKRMRQDKMFAFTIPSIYVSELFNFANVFMTKTEHNIETSAFIVPVDYDKFVDKFLITEHYTTSCAVNKQTQITVKPLAIKQNISFGINPKYSKHRTLLLLKPNAFTPRGTQAILNKILKYVHVQDYAVLKWDELDNNCQKKLHNYFYMNCENRSYGNEWINYLCTFECAVLVIDLPNIKNNLNEFRTMCVDARDESQFIWTRNILHCPTSIEELEINFAAIKNFEKCNHLIDYFK